MTKNEKRFWSKVDHHYASRRCWEWIACKDSDGYGQIRVNGKRLSAHRWSWTVWKGAIPKGLCVLHKCDNPSCVRVLLSDGIPLDPDPLRASDVETPALL